jgi:Amt family ammonium transporter
MGAMVTSWTVQKHPDLTMILNGALAGLVGITAGADAVSVLSAVIIGLVAGVIVVFSVILLDKAKLDDPVGAISVHLTCGIWGTLAVGLFSSDYSFVTQVIGVAAYAAVCFPAALVIFLGVKMVLGLRVSEEDERRGLDLTEHDMEAYPEFETFSLR